MTLRETLRRYWVPLTLIALAGVGYVVVVYGWLR
jgi:hypothetical protein